MDIAFIGLYLLAQIFLGFYVSKFIKNDSDFFIGGRKLPTFAIAFSIFATWFGAETCIGSSAAVFEKGLAGSKAEPFGYGLCLLLTAIIIAPRVWNNKYTTMGDFFKDKAGALNEKLFIWIILPSSLIWAAAQLKAFGHILSVVSGFPILPCLIFSICFVILYTLMGGFIGDVVTDVIQGGILGIGLLIIITFAILGHGANITNIDPQKLSFISDDQTFWQRLDSWMIPIMGSLVAQELIARVLSAKNKSQAVRASFYGTGLYLFFGSIPIILGLIGNQFSLNLTESEQFLPAFSQKVLPPWLYIIFNGALISAILSTIDSILLAASALVSHNFLVPVFNINDDRSKVKSARITLVIFGLIAFFVALIGESVYEMVETASSFGTSGILVASLALMFHQSINQKLISAILISGIILSVLLDLVFKFDASFTLSILILCVFYLFFSFLLKIFKTS